MHMRGRARAAGTQAAGAQAAGAQAAGARAAMYCRGGLRAGGARASGGALRAQKIFFFARAPVRAGKYFLKLSVVHFGGHTHGRRTLFSFARPAGKLNFGFIQLAL